MRPSATVPVAVSVGLLLMGCAKAPPAPRGTTATPAMSSGTVSGSTAAAKTNGRWPNPAAAPPCPPFTSIHMISAIRGWGVTSRAVFRTTDGGRRWTNVLTPAAAPGVSLSADFLGIAHAWVATSDAGRVDVYRTTDGG